MKQATGELNMTVVVVMAIAVIATFFYTVLWPSIKNNFDESTKCDKAICAKKPNADGKTVNCYLKDETKETDEKGSPTGETFECVWKG